MIQLERVNMVYEDGFQALKDINLTFEEGKINVLIGPSGCGKTTTMKLLNRLAKHTDGKILIDGKDIREIDPIELRRQMGYVIQSIGLFPHMTIFDNVATVPKLLKWDKKRIKQRVEELLRMVNLDPKIFMKRYPSELSGGQQQRIGVIRALAAEPSTILMDEPFSALDPISREQLQDELVRLQREIKKTIIFVTHDMDEAIKIADQIILMKDGRIVQKGSPDEILANPSNSFVREFIGEKRLAQSKNLPPLSLFLSKEVPSVSSNASPKQALDEMLAHSISEIAVVDTNNKYAGHLCLYEVMKQPELESIKTLIVKSRPIPAKSNTAYMLAALQKTELTNLPVVDEKGILVGRIDYKKVLEVLQDSIDSKSGVA